MTPLWSVLCFSVLQERPSSLAPFGLSMCPFRIVVESGAPKRDYLHDPLQIPVLLGALPISPREWAPLCAANARGSLLHDDTLIALHLSVGRPRTHRAAMLSMITRCVRVYERVLQPPVLNKDMPSMFSLDVLTPFSECCLQRRHTLGSRGSGCREQLWAAPENRKKGHDPQPLVNDLSMKNLPFCLFPKITSNRNARVAKG